jgi:hypothetical protein
MVSKINYRTKNRRYLYPKKAMRGELSEPSNSFQKQISTEVRKIKDKVGSGGFSSSGFSSAIFFDRNTSNER